MHAVARKLTRAPSPWSRPCLRRASSSSSGSATSASWTGRTPARARESTSRSSVNRVKCAFSTDTLARAFVSSSTVCGPERATSMSMRWIASGVRSSWLARSTRRRSLATDSSIRSSIWLSVAPSSAISSFPLASDSLRSGSEAEMSAACLLIRSTGRSALASASQAPSEMSKSPADPAMASVVASWTCASWRSCREVPTTTTRRPRRATTGTARILVTLAMPGTVLSYSVAWRSDRAPAGESSRDRAMSDVDRSTRPEASSICVNTSTFSISSGLTFTCAGPSSLTLEASRAARELRFASMVASRLDPVCVYTKMLSPATTSATLAPNAMDSRYLIGSLAQRVISYPVTQAPHRLQRGPPEGTVDLAAERADVDVDDPGIAIEGEVPDVLDQRSPCEYIARPAHEVLQQRELGRGELDHATAPQYLVPGRI